MTRSLQNSNARPVRACVAGVQPRQLVRGAVPELVVSSPDVSMPCAPFFIPSAAGPRRTSLLNLAPVSLSAPGSFVAEV